MQTASNGQIFFTHKPCPLLTLPPLPPLPTSHSPLPFFCLFPISFTVCSLFRLLPHAFQSRIRKCVTIPMIVSWHSLLNTCVQQFDLPSIFQSKWYRFYASRFNKKLQYRTTRINVFIMHRQMWLWPSLPEVVIWKLYLWAICTLRSCIFRWFCNLATFLLDILDRSNAHLYELLDIYAPSNKFFSPVLRSDFWWMAIHCEMHRKNFRFFHCNNNVFDCLRFRDVFMKSFITLP